MTRSFSLTFILSILFVSGGFACEICGCSNSNFQIGLLPNFTKGFIGYRYATSQFNSHLRTDATQFSHDYYKTMEAWGGYNFGKFQVMAFMPYVFSLKVRDDCITTSNGAGDVLLSCYDRTIRSTQV